jgi:hypothetical protein
VPSSARRVRNNDPPPAAYVKALVVLLPKDELFTRIPSRQTVSQ